MSTKNTALRTVNVRLGERTYPVVIGPGALSQLTECIRGRRALVVTQEGIPALGEYPVYTLPTGEAAKTVASWEALVRELARREFTRHDVLVSVGGGTVTDVAGFAAATFHRGMPYISVSTTLLGQIDASVGGKVAVNLPEGKNLIGAFWQPEAVLCDTTILQSLPEAEWRCGYGEMAKYVFIAPSVDRNLEDLAKRPLEAQVEACVSLKAQVVASDERDTGLRQLLNYGHTFGHALETYGGHAMSHGEAVAVGIGFAARLARRLGLVDESCVTWHQSVLGEFGLAGTMPEGLEPERIMALLRRDKKAIGDLSFVLMNGQQLQVVRDVPEDAVRETLAETKSRKS